MPSSLTSSCSKEETAGKKIIIKESQRENKKLNCYSTELLLLWFADSAKPLKTHSRSSKKQFNLLSRISVD
jgi:hypothetical protein